MITVDLALSALLIDLQNLDAATDPRDRLRLVDSARRTLELLEREGGGSIGRERIERLSQVLGREHRMLAGE
jgi:hypothetical protein